SLSLAQALPDQPVPNDQERLQGNWRAVTADGEGSLHDLLTVRLTFKGNEIVARHADKTALATFELHPGAAPRQMDVTLTQGPKDVVGKVFPAIYQLEGKRLTIAYRLP